MKARDLGLGQYLSMALQMSLLRSISSKLQGGNNKTCQNSETLLERRQPLTALTVCMVSRL